MPDLSVGYSNLAILVNGQGRFCVDIEQTHRGDKVVLNIKYSEIVQIAFEQIDHDFDSIKGHGLYLSRNAKAQFTSPNVSISVNGGAEEEVQVLEISDSDLKKIQNVAAKALTPPTQANKTSSIVNLDHLGGGISSPSPVFSLDRRVNISRNVATQSRKNQVTHAQREYHLELKSNEKKRTQKRLERQRTRNIEIDLIEKRKKQENV